MNEYFNDLQGKYNYDDKMIFILKKIVIAMIDYYGEEKLDVILRKISSTEIHVKKPGEDPNDYISNSIGIIDKYITSKEVNGYATTRPIVKNDQINSKSIIYLFNDIDLYNPLSWDIIVHELCHIIKMSDFYREDNYIFKYTGFQEEKYDLNGKLINRTLTSIEETTTSHDEVKIMNKLLHRTDYNLFKQESGYALAELYLQKLINYMESIDKGFEEKLSKEGINYASSILTPFGVCFINQFFEKCNQAMYISDKNSIKKEFEELEKIFNLIIKSMEDLTNNYTKISKEECQRLGL